MGRRQGVGGRRNDGDGVERVAQSVQLRIVLLFSTVSCTSYICMLKYLLRPVFAPVDSHLHLQSIPVQPSPVQAQAVQSGKPVDIFEGASAARRRKPKSTVGARKAAEHRALHHASLG